jgi:citrate synthase
VTGPQNSDNLEQQNAFVRGLDNLVIDKTAVSWIDGARGALYYRGINIAELVTHSTFEETAYLLMCGQLPTPNQLGSFSWKIRQMMHTPEKVTRIIQELPPNSQILFTLQTALSALASIESSHRNAEDESLFETSMRMVAQTSVLVAAAYRHSLGTSPVFPRNDLTYSENFLYMLTGKIPSKHYARCMEIALLLQMDNGFTSSTFSARSVASTMTNIYASASAAVAALSGPLVGMSCLAAHEMLSEFRTGLNVEKWIRDRLDRGIRVSGLGHRVYENQDPRAQILENLLENLAGPNEKNSDLFLLRSALAAAQTWHAERGETTIPNADFWAAAVYEKLHLQSYVFPAITACARSVGWASHIMELRADNCLYRPRSLYTGQINVPYVPMSQRQSDRGGCL